MNGNNTDIQVKDMLTFETGVLKLDPSSIQMQSDKGRSITNKTVSDNAFELTIDEMSNNELITITYDAIIDPSAIKPNSQNSNSYVTLSGNSVEVRSNEDIEPYSVNVYTNIDYTPKILKSKTKEQTLDDENIKEFTQTIVANDNPKVSMAGGTITDTIAKKPH